MRKKGGFKTRSKREAPEAELSNSDLERAEDTIAETSDILKFGNKGSEVQIAENRDKTENFIITKFTKKGFHSLTTEELAVVMISPDFSTRFKSQTGQDWNAEYQMKALQKVNQNNFDVHWMTKASPDQNQFAILFLLAKKGDLAKIVQFVHKYGDRCLYAVDHVRLFCFFMLF
jgi:hypothetical protein